MNLLLMQKGYPPAIIKASDRLEYMESLERASVVGEVGSFVAFIAKVVESGLREHLEKDAAASFPLMRSQGGKRGIPLPNAEASPVPMDGCPPIHWREDSHHFRVVDLIETINWNISGPTVSGSG